ncbi:MAG: 1,2-phenylacetyl-CoA epoxidase subunit PaaD [Bacteroidota bacterium]
MNFSKEKILDYLAELPDPEIPVINIIELGIVRGIEITDNAITVRITPTYSGCPAMRQIEQDIASLLKNKGVENLKIETVFSPSWTTDWITEEAKEKLKKYGIAPPEKTTPDKSYLSKSGPKEVECPRCLSKDTKLISQFGSTPCKALYQCNSCMEPFDRFKCI